MNNTNEKTQKPQDTKSKPNEQSGLHIEAKIKITDPETGKVILEKRV